MAADFVHLHVHSDYSLLDGCAAPGMLATRAAEAGMRAIALTDHGVLHGVVQFEKAARDAHINPIIGCELYVATGDRRDRTGSRDGSRASHHLTVLAMNQEGYRNLCRLSSKGFLEGFYYRPRVDKELLRAHSDGLIVLSGCMAAEIPSLIAAGDFEGARDACKWYLDTFGRDRFFLELMDHGIAGQREVNKALLEIGRELGISVVATNDAHYLSPEDAVVQDALICIQTGKELDDPDRLRMETDQLYLKSPAEMERLFGDVPDALRNTVAIAERCDVRLQSDRALLPRYRGEGAEAGAPALLRTIATRGAEARFGRPLPGNVQERLDYELSVIESTGFADYFLIVWDLIRFARSRSIAVGPGRGSSASSLVAYALGITGIDPLAHGLMFERFLNPERVTMPDIDIDFCPQRRAEVIEYAARRFGEDRVAQIGTFGTLAARAAVRDVGRVLGIPYPEVDKVAKAIPGGPGVTLEAAVTQNQELKAEIERNDRLRRLIELGLKVEGRPRHLSVHAAGIVIAPSPLEESAPVCKTSDGAVVTQFSGEDLESLRFLKMDILGLRTLTVLDKAQKLVREHKGVDIDLDAIPRDDPKVYQMLQRGEASGVFQLETQMFYGLLREVRPENFEDLVAILALGRPGPMARLDDYLRFRRGQATPKYPHPAMREILQETHGIMLFQEQVMRIATELAGYSPGRADLLRRAMGKKMPQIMAEERGRFVAAATQRGLEPHVAEAIFDDVARFAEYGFPKGHSAAYALVAYQCAYLKAHYPVEFMAARLSSALGDAGQVSRYIAECRRVGIQLLGPDVNESEVEFAVRDHAIRFGLSGIKNVGASLAAAIVRARSHGPFRSIEDFCDRLADAHVGKKALESLIRSGSFDAILPRAEALSRIDELAKRGSFTRASAGQEALFEAPALPGAPQVAELSLAERLADELSLLGAYVSAHPLDPYREVLGAYAVPDEGDGQVALVGGAVVSLRETSARSGRAMAFAELEDIHGKRCEIVLFPQVYQRDAVVPGDAAIVKGRIEFEEGAVKLVADAVRRIRGAPLVLRLAKVEELDRVRATLAKRRGATPVVLELFGRRASARLALPPIHWVDHDQAVLSELKSLGIDVEFDSLMS